MTIRILMNTVCLLILTEIPYDWGLAPGLKHG